jgi:hypothetical protein
MATRSDISVLWNLSPRLVIIASPSAEVTIQDLHDTLRDIEDEPHAMQYPSLISTAGKEPLGGGVTVGLTATLLNAQVMFERRATIIASGTVTTASDPGVIVQLIDSNASFQTGIEPGDIILNTVDSSHAEVLEVTSDTELKVLSPTGGSENDYDVGEAYQIFANVECSVSGGNLVAQDSVGDPLSPIFPSFGTHVVRTSSSSATLQELEDIQYSSFNGGVTIDTTNGTSGTVYPIGTPRQPVDNLDDAKTIADARGFDTYFVVGDLTVDSGNHPYMLIGQNPTLSTITLDPAANINGASFQNATILGTMDGNSICSDCHIEDLNFFSGTIDRCVLEGTITLGGGIAALILDSWTGDPGAAAPKIDMGGSGQSLSLRNYNGSIEIKEKSGADEVSVDLASGQITINDNVTNGTITLRGVGSWANRDTYVGGATVVDELFEADKLPGDVVTELNTTTYDGVTFDNLMQDMLAMAKGRIVENPSNTFTFYEQDNSTVRFVLIRTGSERVRS